MTRYAPIHARFCPTAWGPFCMVGYREKLQKRLNFIKDLKDLNRVCVLIFLSLSNNLKLCYELNEK